MQYFIWIYIIQLSSGIKKVMFTYSEMWTNMSSPPLRGVINPWPLPRLKLFTRPVSIGLASARAELKIIYIQNRFEIQKNICNNSHTNNNKTQINRNSDRLLKDNVWCLFVCGFVLHLVTIHFNCTQFQWLIYEHQTGHVIVYYI